MRLLIYGSGEFSATVSELARHCGHEVIGMVDDFKSGPSILGGIDEIIRTYSPAEYGFVIAIGYSNLPARWHACQRIRAAGYSTPSIVHPKAYVADTVKMGEGVIVMAGAVVDVYADIDDFVVLWPSTCVNHDTSIGKNTFISPNATICGYVEIGAHCFVGAGAVVADHCRVPEASFVKMLARYNEKKQMKTVVVLQSNYMPWKGYFDLIHEADLFIFYDDVQFTKNDWRNRNKIKTSKGAEWITVPIGADSGSLIYEVMIKDAAWQTKHWKSIRQNYAKCPYFTHYQDFFEYVYLDRQWNNLSEMNQYLIREISIGLLGISTEFVDSRQYSVSGQKLERLLDLVIKAKANRYVSGAAAKGYIDSDRFAVEGIELVWKSYSGYPEYPQRHPPFEHGVSILDLLFNVGPDTPWYIWGWREGWNKPA